MSNQLIEYRLQYYDSLLESNDAESIKEIQNIINNILSKSKLLPLSKNDTNILKKFINYKHSDDNTLILWAIKYENIDLVKHFIEKSDGCIRFCIDLLLRTALETENENVVEILLGHDLIWKYMLKNPELLSIAADYGMCRVIERILKDPLVDLGTFGYDILYDMTYKEDGAECIKILLKNPTIDLIMNGVKLLQNACLNGCEKIVEVLLNDPRVDPSINDNELIQEICEYDHANIVKILLRDPRVNPSANNNYALKHVMKQNNSEIISILLKDPRIDVTNDIDYLLNNLNMNDIQLILPKINKESLKDHKISETVKNLYDVIFKPDIQKELSLEEAIITIGKLMEKYNIHNMSHPDGRCDYTYIGKKTI